jgi:hypothetical protein
LKISATDLPNWADKLSAWSTLAGAVAAFLAAYFVVINIRKATDSIKAQRIASDIQTMLLIWERLDQHWCRYRKVRSADSKRFEFGQLISYYEIACSLFRGKALSTTAAKSLGEHLRDILPQMEDAPEFNKLFDELQSHDHTFENIRWFIKIGSKR